MPGRGRGRIRGRGGRDRQWQCIGGSRPRPPKMVRLCVDEPPAPGVDDGGARRRAARSDRLRRALAGNSPRRQMRGRCLKRWGRTPRPRHRPEGSSGLEEKDRPHLQCPGHRWSPSAGRAGTSSSSRAARSAAGAACAAPRRSARGAVASRRRASGPRSGSRSPTCAREPRTTTRSRHATIAQAWPALARGEGQDAVACP